MPLPYILAALAIAVIVGKTVLESYEDDASRWSGPVFFARSAAEVAPVRAPRFGWIAHFWEPVVVTRRGAAVWRPTRAWAAAAARKRIGS